MHSSYQMSAVLPNFHHNASSINISSTWPQSKVMFHKILSSRKICSDKLNRTHSPVHPVTGDSRPCTMILIGCKLMTQVAEAYMDTGLITSKTGLPWNFQNVFRQQLTGKNTEKLDVTVVTGAAAMKPPPPAIFC